MNPTFERSPEPSSLPSKRAITIGVMYLVLLTLMYIIGHWTSELMPRQAQDPLTTILDQNGNTIAPSHPDIAPLTADVTVADVVDILADYDVIHESRVMSFMRYYGLTDPNTSTIFINSSREVTHGDRVETSIHEILHVIYSRRGLDTRGPYEPLIEARAQEIYHQLFDKKGN